MSTDDNQPLAGTLISTAGRPWALRPEAMRVLLGALEEGITASATVQVPVAPAPTFIANGVAVLPLQGVLTPTDPGPLAALLGAGSGLGRFQSELRKAATNPEVESIVLDVGSPGGLVDQVPETAAMIREVRETKPVTAVANTVAASAAYWLASQANELIVSPSGEVGSIGVYMLHADQSEALEKHGIDVTLTAAGKYKTEGNVYEPLSDSARQSRQDKVDSVYGMFVNDVAAGRGVSPAAVRAGYGEGRALLAADAVASGLADAVATIDNVVETRQLEAVQNDRPAVTAEELERRLAIDLL